LKNKLFHLAFAKNGGAGNVAYSISEEIKSQEHDSTLLFSIESRSVWNIFKNAKAFFLSLIDNYVIKRNSKLPFFSLLRAHVGSKKIQNIIENESLVHMHWIPGLVNFKDLEKLKVKNVKFILTLHDMWFFTGGCHFSNGCTQFVTGCRECPMVHDIFKPLVAKEYAKKNHFFASLANSKITSPSQDLLDKASNSKVFINSDLHLIPNPISNEVAFEGSKESARKISKIDDTSFVVGFVASNINDPRKNLKDAFTAVKDLVSVHPEKNIKFIVVGSGFNRALSKHGFVRQIGPLNDRNTLSAYYASLDVLLLTSREENSPLVAIEALVNNVYVITSSSGGTKELINTSRNGTIYTDVRNLSKTLISCFDSGVYKDVRFENKNNYLLPDVSKKYLDLYAKFE
jgi:glycosyltransferase involved in cell wall biosynthesis